MSLRAKIILYFIALHLVFGVAAIFIVRQNVWLLFAIEGIFAVSIAISVRVIRALFVPLDLIRTGAELISERDFTSHFVPVGQPEMDALISVYNRMIDRLRDERLAGEERHQLLSKLVQESPAGIVICDFDGKPEQMNPAAQRLVTPDVLTQLSTVPTGKSRLIGRGLRVQRAEFRDRGFVKTFYLVEEMTEELRRSEKAAYEKLIRLMSHEVNNSVAAVRSLLESMLRYARDVREDDRDDYTTAIDVASRRVDALGKFVSGFADVVRIPPPHKAPMNVTATVQRLAALMRAEAESRGVKLVADVDGEQFISADALQLEQVIINVLRNALDAAGDGGTVRIAVRDGALSVTDTGAGIREEYRAQLFTPFFTTKRDGRGIGLTVVQEILSNHGFRFSLENRAEGGAEFKVSFRA